MDSQERDRHLERIARDGYTLIEQVFDDAWADALVAELDRLETSLGILPSENEFEGSHTWRIYNLLAHGKRFEEIPGAKRGEVKLRFARKHRDEAHTLASTLQLRLSERKLELMDDEMRRLED